MAVEQRAEAPQLSAGALSSIGAAVAAGKFEQAHDLAQAEIDRGCVHPALYNTRAMWLERQQRDREALIDYQRARMLVPGNPIVLGAIGLCHTRLFQFQEAVAAFDEALRANPLFMPGYIRKAEALAMAGDFDGARRVFERAVSLDPRNVEALAGLSSLAAQRGDMKKAVDFAQRAVTVEPAEPTAQAVLAQVDNSRGDFASAEERVRPLLQDSRIAGKGRASLFGILGDALNGQHRLGEAFEAYTAENMELLRLNSIRFAGAPRLADLCNSLIAHYTDRAIAPQTDDRSESAIDGGPAGHVFLLGFYRSGTTLLEQALEAHPGIVTLEEREVLGAEAERFLTSSTGLARLEDLSGDELQNARGAYWRNVGREGVIVRGKIFVDKHPLNTLKLPIIAKLFPDAKILFAVRDPRDVVLSCYRRHFQINAAMYELLTLQGAARLYDAVMRFAGIMRENAPLKVMDCRYEKIVEDFEASLRAVCEFIGVEYSAAMENFSSVLRANEIRSPSALQVKRGLYREGVAQWRPYAAQLDAVAPILNRWVEHFGYPAE